MSKPEFETDKYLDIICVLSYFVKEGRITSGDKKDFWDKYMDYPNNESLMGFHPLDAREYIESEGAKKVVELLIEEYGEEEYYFKVSW